MALVLGLDIGSNSVGSALVDNQTGQITVGVSVFPAGVDESDEKRGDPKNAKRRATRRARVTLARRSQRKRTLRLKLISAGLLPADANEFQGLLERTDPWVLRRKGLTEPLSPHEFGRVLLHLAQRRGAVGFDAEVGDTGKVKAAMTDLQMAMLSRFGDAEAREAQQKQRAQIETLSQKKKRTDQENTDLDQAREKLKEDCRSLLKNNFVTFGRFMAELRDERRTEITTEDRRKEKRGSREWREPVRNKQGRFEFHADRLMIRDEFTKLWDAQKRLGGPVALMLTDELRRALDDDTRRSGWRHQGLLFGQRMQSWDLGTLGRCVMHPSDRCAPHADMHAARFRVVEMVNNLRIVERGQPERCLTPQERAKIKDYLSGPLGVATTGKQKGQPKRSVTVTDLRELMGWGRAGKTTPYRFNLEVSDEERDINTDWFSREIICGAFARKEWEPLPLTHDDREKAFRRSMEKWQALPERIREGLNRAILQFDPDDETAAPKLKAGSMSWAGLTEEQADALVNAWKARPRLDAKRLNMSRRAVRNILVPMDQEEPWPDPEQPGQIHWLTQIEARKRIAADNDFVDVTTGQRLDEHTRRRYATGAKGATARDRHYLKMHLLKKNGECVHGPDGLPLHEPPPAPLISNPVVRKAIHEVRRHLIEYLITFGRKPDQVYIELSREAKMGKVESDRLLLKNRLRNRIRNDIIREFNLGGLSSTQQRAAVDRVILCVQQKCVCPLCGNQTVMNEITPRMAADGQGCEAAHIFPKGSGGHNGLGNLVLAHTKCNRDMSRRTPRQFWEATTGASFEKGTSWVEAIYGGIDRPKPSELKAATGNSLWVSYFTRRDDTAKIAQFKKGLEDHQGMTARQDAATKYATRQVMAYLADALFDGQGLPERGGERRIFATDGMWTSRLRREWGLLFDPHHFRVSGLSNDQEHARKEKDRGDHRHHAIDAVVIALSSQQIKNAWEAREKEADRRKVNTADEQQMAAFRKAHPLSVPFKTREEFREIVQRAVFGERGQERPVCHRPVKQKLIGALHEETLFGPVVDSQGKLTSNYTAKKSVAALKPDHLRVADPGTGEDPPPGKGGIVRDRALRMRIRECLSGYRYVKKSKSGDATGEGWLVNPDDFTANEILQALQAGSICHKSGVPIRSVVLLRTMSDPVIIDRKRQDHATGRYVADDDPASKRAYVGGNNHHIEIRVAKNKKGVEKWSGTVVTAYEAAQRKLAKLRAFQAAGVPNSKAIRKLPKAERQKFQPLLREIEKAHPLVSKADTDEGKFVLSLCEGEMLWMKHKKSGEVGYFVVAKLDKPQTIVVVPHWDARAAGERKDAEGNRVAESKRESFEVTPNDLKTLAPPNEPHAVKVRVSPLGIVRRIQD